MKHDVRLRQRATVYRVSAQDMVQFVVNRLLSCPVVCGFCAWGAALGNARKDTPPPCPKGRSQRAAAPGTLADLQGARAGEIPDCSSLFPPHSLHARLRLLESPSGDSTSKWWSEAGPSKW